MTLAFPQITTVAGVDAEGNDIIETVEGFHVDTLEPLEGAEDYLTTPATPQHGFLGVPLDEVYRYKFAGEAEFAQFDPRPQSKEEAELITNSEVL